MQLVEQQTRVRQSRPRLIVLPEQLAPLPCRPVSIGQPRQHRGKLGGRAEFQRLGQPSPVTFGFIRQSCENRRQRARFSHISDAAGKGADHMAMTFDLIAKRRRVVHPEAQIDGQPLEAVEVRCRAFFRMGTPGE